MSFMISIYLKEGLVMASSRLSTNTLFPTNTEGKSQKCIFKTFNDIGISVSGKAIYDYENLIESFILLHNDVQLTVTEFAYNFKNFLVEMEMQSEFCFHIGGYERISGKKKLKVYKISYPEETIEQLNSETKDGTVTGTAWSGEQNILNELIKPLFTIDLKGDMVKLPEYSMPWELFNLQEAIDFAYLAIKNSLEFKRKIYNSAMEVTPIDLLVVTEKGANWLSLNNPDEVTHKLVQTC